MPIVPCEIVMDDGQRGEIWLSDEDSKNLFRHLTNWKWLSTMGSARKVAHFGSWPSMER